MNPPQSDSDPVRQAWRRDRARLEALRDVPEVGREGFALACYEAGYAACQAARREFVLTTTEAQQFRILLRSAFGVLAWRELQERLDVFLGMTPAEDAAPPSADGPAAW